MKDEFRENYRIAMLVRNNVVHDSRVLKEAQTLAENGYQIKIFGLADHDFPPGDSIIAGVSVIHVLADQEPSRFRLGPVIATALYLLLEQFRTPKIPSTNSEAKRTRRLYRFKQPESDSHTSDSHLHEADCGMRLGHEHRDTLVGVLFRKLFGKQSASFDPFPRNVNRYFANLVYDFLRPLGIAHYGRSYSQAVVSHVENWAPDILHCHDAECGLAVLALAESRTLRVVYDSHELWLHRNTPAHVGFLGKLVRRWECRIESEVVKRANQILTVNSGIAREIESQYKLAKGTVEVVRNIPVSENTPSRALDLGGLREISGEILIAYSGRITNHRLLHELVSALSQLRHPVTLILVGYGSAAYVESLRQYALEVQLRLIIVGPVPPDSVIKTLSSTDVIFVGVDPIVRSYALSLPNKYFEALMSDRPVVFPSLPEMFKHAMGFEGTHPFDVDDPFSLRTQLCNAIATVHEGVIFPRRSLGWESEAKVLLAAYSSMLNYGPRETIQ